MRNRAVCGGERHLLLGAGALHVCQSGAARHGGGRGAVHHACPEPFRLRAGEHGCRGRVSMCPSSLSWSFWLAKFLPRRFAPNLTPHAALIMAVAAISSAVLSAGLIFLASPPAGPHRPRGRCGPPSSAWRSTRPEQRRSYHSNEHELTVGEAGRRGAKFRPHELCVSPVLCRSDGCSGWLQTFSAAYHPGSFAGNRCSILCAIWPSASPAPCWRSTSSSGTICGRHSNLR